MKVNSVLAIGASVALALMCSFCRPQKIVNTCPAAKPSPDREADATVVILDADTGAPCCSAVSVYGQDGSAVLVTAAHCVKRKEDKLDISPSAKKVSKVGDTIRFVTREDWYGTGSYSLPAIIKIADDVRDRAVLTVNQYEAPAPLNKTDFRYANSPDVGVRVHGVSARFGWVSRNGRLNHVQYSGLGTYFFESDMSIDKGWSGSPIMSDDGTVIGIVIMCNVTENDHENKSNLPCDQGWTLITSIP